MTGFRTHPEQTPISPDHLREHFMHGVSGTITDGARLDIDIVTEIDAPYVQELILDSIDVEDCMALAVSPHGCHR
jgi:hypothetical protein